MKVVIDISEEIYKVYKDIKKLYEISITDKAIYEGIVAVAIKNGTPLPNVHGDLIVKPTEEEIAKTIGSNNGFAECIKEAVKAVFDNATTIIPAAEDIEKEKEFEEER